MSSSRIQTALRTSSILLCTFFIESICLGFDFSASVLSLSAICWSIIILLIGSINNITVNALQTLIQCQKLKNKQWPEGDSLMIWGERFCGITAVVNTARHITVLTSTASNSTCRTSHIHFGIVNCTHHVYASALTPTKMCIHAINSMQGILSMTWNDCNAFLSSLFLATPDRQL